MDKQHKQNKIVMAKNTKSKASATLINDAGVESAPIAGGPSKSMLALLAPTAGAKNLVRRNMPAMVKPGEVPIGSAISGEIIAVVNSPVSTVKGKLLHVRHESGTEFTFPATGVIRNALAPGVENEKELQTALEKFVGKTIVCKRLEDKQSAKYKKSMYMFDVYTD